VTERFYDKLDVLAKELNGDARALLDAIDAKEVKGFRSEKRQELEEWLRDHQYLVDRLPLSDDEVELRVLGAVTPFVEDGTMDAGMVRQRVRELRTGMTC
jgi:hypothetical protein